VHQKLMRGLGIVAIENQARYDTALASPGWGHASAAARHPLPRSMYDSDCVVVMGSNMAGEPPGRVPLAHEAKVDHGAKIIMSTRALRARVRSPISMPVRAGSDIAFLGGVINTFSTVRSGTRTRSSKRFGRELHECRQPSSTRTSRTPKI